MTPPHARSYDSTTTMTWLVRDDNNDAVALSHFLFLSLSLPLPPSPSLSLPLPPSPSLSLPLPPSPSLSLTYLGATQRRDL
jgi:hypothetical protein